MDALNLLNYNEWRLVFRKLNSVDLLSCRQVCTSFLKLLDEQEFQQKWKFYIALPQLLPYLKMTTQNKPFVSWNNLKSIRLTSKSWRESVDYVTEMYEPSTVFYINFRDKPLATCLKSSEEIDEFHETFGDANTNPFPSRTVFITCPRIFIDGPQDPEEEEAWNGQAWIEHHIAVLELQDAYLEKVGNFVEQFGINIVKIELHLRFHYPAGAVSICKLIKRITQFVPNMKTFVITCPIDHGHLETPFQVSRYIVQNPLGDLPKLQALRIGLSNPTVEAYLLDKYASQLTHFERMYPCSQPRLLELEEHVKKFTNLRKLWLELSDKDYPVILESRECPPLKFLGLSLQALTYRHQLMESYIDKIIRSLNNLPLEYLEIRLPLFQINSDAHARSNLACLNVDEYINASIQTLRIHIFLKDDDAKVSFNFLEAFKKLETLELEFSPGPGQVPTGHPANYPETVKLIEYVVMGEGRTELPYQSNVWEKVPSLKTLILKWERGLWWERAGLVQFTYTRKEYERVRTSH